MYTEYFNTNKPNIKDHKELSPSKGFQSDLIFNFSENQNHGLDYYKASKLGFNESEPIDMNLWSEIKVPVRLTDLVIKFNLLKTDDLDNTLKKVKETMISAQEELGIKNIGNTNAYTKGNTDHQQFSREELTRATHCFDLKVNGNNNPYILEKAFESKEAQDSQVDRDIKKIIKYINRPTLLSAANHNK